MSHDTLDTAGPILQSLPQPILVCGPDNAIHQANYAAEAFFGASTSILTRQKLNDFVAFGSPVLNLVETVNAQRAPRVEYRMRVSPNRVGPDRTVDVFAAPLADKEGEVVLLFQERTVADTIDRQLIFRGAARSVSGLAAVLAHEIKNPLSGIRGAAQLLEQSVSDDERPLAQLIREETDRIVRLLERVDVFGDDRPLERTPVNIHVVLERVKLIAKSGIAQRIKIVEDYDPSLPPLLGNQDRLVQVFLNLVKNAAEAIENEPKPEIRLSTAFRPGIRIGVAGTGRRVSLPLEVVVEDNGPGIPTDMVPFLYDPFVTTKPDGSGLGLALVAKVIGDHGGVIDIDSKPGRTRFRILLPVAEKADQVLARAPHKGQHKNKDKG